MKMRTCALGRLPHISPRWAWVSLVPFLAGACKPRDLVCEDGSYFQVLQPAEGAGAAPFSIERLGPEVKSADLAGMPEVLILKSNNRVRVSWASTDLSLETDLIFSPSEGLARDVKVPEYVHPMRRFSDGASERVRFGFRSPLCRGPRKFGICDMGNDNLFLAAELPCHPEQESRFSR